MQEKIKIHQIYSDRIVFNNVGSNKIISRLCGPLDLNIKTISKITKTKITRIGNIFKLEGDNLLFAKKALYMFYEQAKNHEIIEKDIFLVLAKMKEEEIYHEKSSDETIQSDVYYNLYGFKPRTYQQSQYIRSIFSNDINFGIGPAGTGKTMLAVACAVKLLELKMVEKIILTRPAVEAGEKLGFLPGDLTQKIDPYLRPLYDALYEMMGLDRVQKLIDKQIIEIAPLAYMRGRTINNSFIILDESQNTTKEQMKMFLTRIGFSSKAVITGDPSQIDLQKGQKSGLSHAISILNEIDGISITQFTKKDIMRHHLVSKIVDAYERNKN